MPLKIAPPPIREKVVGEDNLVTRQWSQHFQSMWNVVGNPPEITGSKAGNVAVANLLTELARIGLIVDSTT